MLVHEGGSSTIAIDFCPGCGAKLPEAPSGWTSLAIDRHSRFRFTQPSCDQAHTRRSPESCCRL
ncbi:DUF6980 family protein [Bryobacter aggregatus]|uniref:DUF6980 family protein n=1 Tax=Bryobacter aggregatus TaxID=360054 RepID=UPI003B514B77